MEPNDQSFLSPTSSDERLEVAGDLLEECWFFENMLDRKARMLRCHSDPCPSSSSVSQEMLVWNSCIEAPSPSRKQPIDNNDSVQPKESESTQSSSRHGLLRAPSLPPCIGRKESEPRTSKLTRQASLNSSDVLPPPHKSKGMMKQQYSMQRHAPQRLPKAMSLNTRYPSQTKMTKSLSDLECEEVQGFKDLGFSFDKEDLSPTVINILPGLQEKNHVNSNDDKVRRPYLSEAWQVQDPAPPIPNWVVKNSAEDMKTQIKFWARAVASNVR